MFVKNKWKPKPVYYISQRKKKHIQRGTTMAFYRAFPNAKANFASSSGGHFIEERTIY